VLKGKRDVLAMLLGTLLIGVSGYLFLAVIGHGRFGPATTAALSATYLLAAVLGPGVFVALEQGCPTGAARHPVACSHRSVLSVRDSRR
jgi:hypothetical protein